MVPIQQALANQQKFRVESSCDYCYSVGRFIANNECNTMGWVGCTAVCTHTEPSFVGVRGTSVTPYNTQIQGGG
jgi:hypothetical protein